MRWLTGGTVELSKSSLTTNNSSPQAEKQLFEKYSVCVGVIKFNGSDVGMTRERTHLCCVSLLKRQSRDIYIILLNPISGRGCLFGPSHRKPTSQKHARNKDNIKFGNKILHKNEFLFYSNLMRV